VARWEDFAMATQSVYHGAAYPSRVLLPVVPSSPIATER
jgi:predicted acyl esterase